MSDDQKFDWLHKEIIEMRKDIKILLGEKNVRLGITIAISVIISVAFKLVFK